MVTPMMSEQLALEEEMRSVTRHRYFQLHKKAEEREDMSETHVGRNVADHVYDTFLAEVEAWYTAAMDGAKRRKARAALLIQDFDDIPALCFIFMKHLLNQTLKLEEVDKSKQARLTRVALSTTGAIHDELRMRYFEQNRKALLRRIIKDFQQRDLSRRRRRELMIKQFNTQQLEWEAEGWNQQARLQLGIVLVDLFRRSTGMIEERVVYEGKKSVNCICFTDEAINILKDRMDAAADLFTVFYPTVVPPKPWSNDALIGGGYYSDMVKPYKFIKGAKIKYLAELEATDMSKVIDPINAMQETPWRVNPVMLEVLTSIYESGLKVKGLPPCDPTPIPAPVVNIEEDDEAAKEYRKECYLIHEMNRRAISKRISVMRTISLAGKFAAHEAIYFPCDLDSRGRAYPKVPFLNPQGPDYVKSLLEFSEGKQLGEEGEAYLAIAVANAWGQDKLSLQDRVDWVYENQAMLLEVAADPLGDFRWLDADEPFMALRGALEWEGLCREGANFVSHMPVHFDATCSGLQHFSALLRDAEGGFYVNLTGDETRQDIYGEVARKATLSIEACLSDPDTCDIARLALEMGISRSLCKRPVMIVPYAGTFSSCMAYVNDHYREREEDGEALPVDAATIRKTVTPFVAKHIWAAISNTVIAARGAMDWITSTARLASKGQTAPIQWTTPDGMVVQQAKYEEVAHKVDTYLDGGRRVQSRIVKETQHLDSRQMSQSLSPNYIHSLDAAHMRGSIRKAMDIGGMSFAMIHDSFGVHAADMHTFLHACIKPAFVEMYEDGRTLERFKEELMVNIEDKEQVTPLPSAGTLDLEGVLDSQFFFS